MVKDGRLLYRPNNANDIPTVRLHNESMATLRGRLVPGPVTFSSPASVDLQGEDLKQLAFELDGSADINVYVSRNEPDVGASYTYPHQDPAIKWEIVGYFKIHPSFPNAPGWVVAATRGRRYVKLVLENGGPVTSIYFR